MRRFSLSLSEIAARCGVSRATVCKALSPVGTRYRIAPATRERILAVVREADPQATAEAGRQRGRIALLVRGQGRHWGSLNSQLIIGLITALQRRHLDGRFISMDVGSREDRRRAVAETDGCILADTVLADDAVWRGWLDEIRSFPPTVVLNPGRRLPIPAVGPDDAGGCRQLVAGLAARGHRQLAIAGHLRGSHQHGSQGIRYQAVLAAAVEHGLHLVDWVDHSCTAVMERLIAAEPRPTALIDITSSRMPENLIRLLQRGWKVPEDLALAQVDDPDFARYQLPAITSIGWSMEEYVDQAMRHLEAAMHGRPAPTDGLVAATVHWRASTGD